MSGTASGDIKQSFVPLYAAKLKEMRETPYSKLDIRLLERQAERFLEGVLAAVNGNRKPLERFVQQILLLRSQTHVRAWQVLEALDTGRTLLRRFGWTAEQREQLDDSLHWATIKFSQLYEEMQTEQGLAKMVESLTLALEAKERYSSSHSQGVQKIAEKIAKTLGVHVGLAGIFHDIGKIYVPDAILGKPTSLTPEEWEVMKQHPYHSFRIVSPIAPTTASLCLRHHERPDGRGYPLGEVNGPIEANVIAAADTLHAVCSQRSYQSSQKLETAIQIVGAGRGTRFYPEVVDAVQRNYGDMGALLARLASPAQCAPAPVAQA